MIEFQSVGMQYLRENGEPDVIFKDLSFQAKPGHIVCVLGGNGTGKTTLLRMATGLLEPSGGTILRDSHAPRPRGIGFVDQHYRRSLFPWLSAGRNIALTGATSVRTNEALERFGIEQLADRRVHTLSGGQAQLVAVARAVSMAGPLIADEPTSALDLRRAYSTCLALRNIVQHEQRICIVSTHEIELGLLMADQLVVMPSSRENAVRLFAVTLDTRSREVMSTAAFTCLRLQVLEHLFK